MSSSCTTLLVRFGVSGGLGQTCFLFRDAAHSGKCLSLKEETDAFINQYDPAGPLPLGAEVLAPSTCPGHTHTPELLAGYLPTEMSSVTQNQVMMCLTLWVPGRQWPLLPTTHMGEAMLSPWSQGGPSTPVPTPGERGHVTGVLSTTWHLYCEATSLEREGYTRVPGTQASWLAVQALASRAWDLLLWLGLHV